MSMNYFNQFTDEASEDYDLPDIFDEGIASETIDPDEEEIGIGVHEDVATEDIFDTIVDIQMRHEERQRQKQERRKAKGKVKEPPMTPSSEIIQKADELSKEYNIQRVRPIENDLSKNQLKSMLKRDLEHWLQAIKNSRKFKEELSNIEKAYAKGDPNDNSEYAYVWDTSDGSKPKVPVMTRYFKISIFEDYQYAINFYVMEEAEQEFCSHMSWIPKDLAILAEAKYKRYFSEISYGDGDEGCVYFDYRPSLYSIEAKESLSDIDLAFDFDFDIATEALDDDLEELGNMDGTNDDDGDNEGENEDTPNDTSDDTENDDGTDEGGGDDTEDLAAATDEQLTDDNQSPDDEMEGGDTDTTDTDMDTGAASDTLGSDPLRSVETKKAFRDKFVILYNVTGDSLESMEDFTPEYKTKVAAKYYQIRTNLSELRDLIFKLCTEKMNSMTVDEVLRKYAECNMLYQTSLKDMKDFKEAYNRECAANEKKSSRK